MELATQYARALYEAKDKNLANLRAALRRRGHTGLLPRIFSEYEKLELRQRRRTQASRVTPERERTRVLLDLYHTLASSQSK